jgi:hypothetical protein
MSTLYIIGNGFDLWHELKTSYSAFYEYAKETLDDIGAHYDFDLSKPEPWSDFENALGKYSPDFFFDAYNDIDVNDENFRPSYVYGLEDEIVQETDHHVQAIKDIFEEWIHQIDISNTDRRTFFPPNSKFINFNYTSTLQVAYGISHERVFHIHGCVEKFDDLIFGHGQNIEELPEFDALGESTRTIFSDAEGAARYPLWALKKPVNDVLTQNEIYFSQLTDIDEIVVIGHSLNTIDEPYIQQIAASAINAQWKVCCFTDEERKIFPKRLVECGVNLNKIEVITYSDLERFFVERT